MVVDQKSLLFQPHVIVVLAGSTVDFLNSDNVQHNIFWPAISGNKKLSHNMGTWPKGEIRSFKFDTPGVVPLLCNVHPEMSGFIIVSPTPYYAEADASGAFQDRQRSGRQLHRDGMARRHEGPIEARHRLRHRDGGLHAHQVASAPGPPFMRTRFRDKKVDRDWLNTNFPCMMACPAQTNAGRYVALIAEGKFEEAYRYARDPNPMASICGRVCAHPCETACRRGAIDKPIAIRALKRFLTERYGPESRHPIAAAAAHHRETALPRGHHRQRPGGTFGRARSGADGLLGHHLRGRAGGRRHAVSRNSGVPPSAQRGGSAGARDSGSGRHHAEAQSRRGARLHRSPACAAKDSTRW